MSYVTRQVAGQRMCPLRSQSLVATPCIADRCMAWRWYADDLGCCGLAGDPAEFVSKKRGKYDEK